METVLSYDSIVELMRDNIARVVFTKSDGSERVMHCTLIKDYLPLQKDVEEYSTNINKNAVAVWDIEHRGWRSFRLDSVKSIEWNPKVEANDNPVGIDI